MIELKNIFKWVNSGGNRVFLLKDINLSIKEGEFISIMGPSGSGKSTLLNVIGMLDEFNEGEYLFMDQPVHQLKEKQKAQFYKTYIGFVFQAYHLIDELTVYENIETPLLYQKGVEIMELFKQLNEEDGVTIIQATHSEKNAAYGSKIINLLDGIVEK